MRATGVGSMPGTDSREAASIVTGELDDLIHVPELPQRGPGAELIGRTAAMLSAVASDLALDTVPTGWRVIDAPGRTMRRAASWLNEDLDQLEELSQGYSGTVKTQIAGPWTLAASIEGRNGERLVADSGACREIAQALAAAARDHVTELQRRFPGARGFDLQLDEPMLNHVIDGTIASASGLSRYRAVELPVVTETLAQVIGALDELICVGVHSCASSPRIDVMHKAGAEFVSIDLRSVEAACDAELGEVLESGVRLFAGTVPSLRARVSDADAGRPIAALGDRLGLAELVRRTVVVTPTCGLAGADPGWPVTAYRVCKQAARGLVDSHDEE